MFYLTAVEPLKSYVFIPHIPKKNSEFKLRDLLEQPKHTNKFRTGVGSSALGLSVVKHLHLSSELIEMARSSSRLTPGTPFVSNFCLGNWKPPKTSNPVALKIGHQRLSRQEEQFQILLANFIASTWCLCWNPRGVLLKAEVSGSHFQRCSHKSAKLLAAWQKKSLSGVGLIVRAVALLWLSFGWLYQTHGIHVWYI